MTTLRVTQALNKGSITGENVSLFANESKPTLRLGHEAE
jgi:hypothetical protein